MANDLHLKNGSLIEEMHPQIMETRVIYNVRRNTWHTVLLSQDASVLLVEECDTGEKNTEYLELSMELHHQIKEIAQKGQIP